MKDWSGHAPFLRAIAFAPDDDAPKLVYADWLAERGEDHEAERVRALAGGLTEAQWELLREVTGRMVREESSGGNVRILIGGYTYPLFGEHSGKKVGRKLFDTIRAEAAKVRAGAAWEITSGFRLACNAKWDKIIRRSFGTEFLFQYLGKIITAAVRAKGVSMRSLGLSGTDLSMDASDILLSRLCGREGGREGRLDFMYFDPADIPDAAERLKVTVDNFDPWVFDWSQVLIQPRQRTRMAAAGFQFGRPPGDG